MVKRKLLFLVAIVSLLTISSCKPQQAMEERMQKVLDREISKSDTRGVSAAVIFPDGKTWTGVSGISHDTVAIKPDMLFAIGSVTKNIVAALVLKLAEENALSLEDPLSKWLPAYPHVDRSISIRQLLNHTSGLYMFWDNQEIWDALKADRSKVWTPEGVLAYIKEPYFAPGEGWRYSNTNYLLLGMIIEKATGSKLSTEFRKRFWQPLGIENAYLSIEEDIPLNQLAHVFGDNFQYGATETDLTFLPRASHESIAYGSSGIFTSAEDLARWCHILFGGEVLQQQSMDEMLEFVKFRPVANMRAYGLGVQLFPKAFSSGKETIGHGGGNIGTATYMVHLPDYCISMVVMVNAFPTNSVSVITKRLIRVVLREQKAIGWIPYFKFFPAGLPITGFVIVLVVLIIRRRRKRWRLR